jgi:hypothetical protein
VTETTPPTTGPLTIPEIDIGSSQTIPNISEWRLPSGRTIAEASPRELDDIGHALHRLAQAKRQHLDVNSRKLADSEIPIRGDAAGDIYEVTLDGRRIGDVRRVGGYRSGKCWAYVTNDGALSLLRFRSRRAAGKMLVRLCS